MIKDDWSIWQYILLSIVTCGFYSYYFIYTIARDTNIMCDTDGKSTGGLLKFIGLSIITCGIYAWYWYYTLGNRLAENAPRYGLRFEENGTTVLLWLLFGSLLCGAGIYVSMNIIIKNVNAMAREYNRGNAYVQNQPAQEQNIFEPEEGLQKSAKQYTLPSSSEEISKGCGKTTCHICSREINEKAAFCKYCGAEAASSARVVKSDIPNCCPKCGQIADEGEKFCILCGTPITSKSGSDMAGTLPGASEELSDENATVLILEGSEYAAPAVYLRRDTTDEMIHIDHTPFNIGTDETYADYIVKDNPRISRRHAVILQENGQYYLSDMDSSNSTFLNGIKIGENKILRDGDIIHLADEKVIFKID